MAVRIRLYPNGAAGGMNGGMYGGQQAALAKAYYGQQARNIKETAQMQLQYERALGKERIELAKMQTAIPFLTQQPNVSPWGSPFGSYGQNPYALMGAAGVFPGATSISHPNIGVMAPGFGSGGWMGGLLNGFGF